MSQTFNVANINPATTSPATDISILTAALLALQSNFSGATLPTTNLVAGQVALDTPNKVYWKRDSANVKWMLYAPDDVVNVVSKSAVYSAQLSDYTKTFICTNSWALGFAAVATLTDGWFCWARNDGTGVITLTPTTGTIDGAASIQIAPGETCGIFCDGTQLKTFGRISPAAQTQAATAFTSAGTSTAFTLTPVPALVALVSGQRFRVNFNQASGANPTLSISGLAATSLMQYSANGTKVAAAVAAGQLSDVEYDGANYVVLDPLPPVAQPDPSFFYKLNASAPAFIKTAAGTISVLAGTSALVYGTKLTWATNTAVTMPTLTAGTDYAIYACQDGTIRADASFSAPTGYTTANSRLIGGFHYGLVAPATTLAGGSFNTAGSVTTGGMVWVQSNVDDIAGINKYSLWDLKFRAACGNNAGMVLVNNRTWVDIYLCSTDTAANGTSKYNTNIASGTVLPKVPAAFGGNGTITYAAGDWWSFSEIARANGKRFMLASEFYDAAFGVTESQSIDATASTYPTTLRNAGYTSKYGIEQASGHHYIWGMDSAGSASAWVGNDGRGQSYNNSIIRVILGGARTSGANSGSRCSNWNFVTSYSYWIIGLRAACDHLQSV